MELNFKNGIVNHVNNLNELGYLLNNVDETQIIVLDFSATWCGPCQSIKPVYKRLSKEFPRILFIEIDYEKNKEIEEKFKIKGFPTFIFIQNNTVLKKFSGADVNKLENTLLEISE